MPMRPGAPFVRGRRRKKFRQASSGHHVVALRIEQIVRSTEDPVEASHVHLQRGRSAVL